MTSSTRGFLLTAISAIAFSTLPIFTKLAYETGINTPTLLVCRFALAAVLLTILVKKQGYSLFSFAPRKILSMFLLGILGYAVMAGLYMGSLNYISPSLATILLYTYPVIVFALSVLLKTEQFSLYTGSVLLTSLIGVILVVGSSLGFNVHTEGLLLAAGSALVYSLYILVGERINKNVPPIVTLAYVCIAAALTHLCVGMASDSLYLGTVTARGFLWIVCIVLIPTIVSCWTFFEGMKLIGASNASILSNIEPVATVILSYLVFQDMLKTTQLLGGFIVLACVVLLECRKWIVKPKQTISQ